MLVHTSLLLVCCLPRSKYTVYMIAWGRNGYITEIKNEPAPVKLYCSAALAFCAADSCALLWQLCAQLLRRMPI